MQKFKFTKKKTRNIFLKNEEIISQFFWPLMLRLILILIFLSIIYTFVGPMKGIEENIDRQHFLDIKNISIIFLTRSVPNKNIFGGNYKNLIKIYSLFLSKKNKDNETNPFFISFSFAPDIGNKFKTIKNSIQI